MKTAEQLRLEKIIKPHLERMLEDLPEGKPERKVYEVRLAEVNLAIQEYDDSRLSRRRPYSGRGW